MIYILLILFIDLTIKTELLNKYVNRFRYNKYNPSTALCFKKKSVTKFSTLQLV